MANQITFTDKVDAQVSALPAINKSRAEDWNEVKTVVNTNAIELDGTTAKANQNETDIATNEGDITANTANIATNAADIAALQLGLSPIASTLPVTFDKEVGRVYGTPSAPLTGALTFSDSPAPVNGGKVLIWYNDSSDPLDPIPSMTGATIRKYGGQLFGADTLMAYEGYYQEDGATDTVKITTERGDNSPPTVTNVALVDGANIQVNVQLSLTKTYSQPESIIEDPTRLKLQIWAADTAAELTQAAIEAGTPDLIADTSDGTTTWTPLAAQETRYVVARVRAYSTDPNAPGSTWAYSPVYGPVAASSSFSPLSISAVNPWANFSTSDGGIVAGTPDHWETVKNLADGTGDTDWVQTSGGNQADISNQATAFSALFDNSNIRYFGTSWVSPTPIFALDQERSFYLLVKLPVGVSGFEPIMYFANRIVYADTSDNKITIQSGSNESPVNCIDPTGWILFKMGFRTSPSAQSYMEVLAGAGAGGGSSTTSSNELGQEISNASGQTIDFRPQFASGSVEFRHFIAVDDATITAQERTDLETWLLAQHAL